MANRKIKVVGLGGIGTCLIEPLARYLAFLEGNTEITLIDGDEYEEKNRQRQKFHRLGNKAEVTAERLQTEYPSVHFRSKTDFITNDNVISLIRDGDVIMVGVDNHATRKVICDRCEELQNVTIISGGNDKTDGNVFYYSKKNGKASGRLPTAIDKKIANPTDKNPGNLSAEERTGCAREYEENPQLLNTNNMAAAHMLNVLVAHENSNAKFEQVFFDTNTHRSRPSPEPQY